MLHTCIFLVLSFAVFNSIVLKYGFLLPGILIICVLSTQVVQAQMIYDTLLLDELEILANKVDRSQTVQKTTIDTLFKTELDNLDLGELLAAYTPVYIKSYGKGALTTASFRGTGASHTQVLWNGFQINSPMLGQLDFSQVPNSFIDGIDLYYGGGSLFMSGGALGGSVAIENISALMHNPQIGIEQTFGSFQSLATNANLLYGNSKFGSDTRFAYQSSENDFTYTNIAVIPQEEMTQTNAAFQNIGFTQQFSWQPTASQQISIISWNQWNSRDIPSIMTNVNKGGDPQEYQNGFFSRNIIK